MGTVHQDHPTLYRAADLDHGWRLLHYPEMRRIAYVERGEERVLVHFEGGRSDAWHPGDQVHALPSEG